MMSSSNVRLNGYAMMRAAQTPALKSQIEDVLRGIVVHARKFGPKTRGRAYTKNIEPWIDTDDGIYLGLVVASRHEMVVEFGWTDRAGNWHPGRYVLTNALKSQAEGRVPAGPVTPKPDNRKATAGRIGSAREWIALFGFARPEDRRASM